MHSTIDYSPLEVFYSFNYLTHLDLFPLPIDEMISLNDNRKPHVVKAIHENVWENTKKIEQCAFKANKRWNGVLFLTRLLGLSAYEKKKIFLTKEI